MPTAPTTPANVPDTNVRFRIRLRVKRLEARLNKPGSVWLQMWRNDTEGPTVPYPVKPGPEGNNVWQKEDDVPKEGLDFSIAPGVYALVFKLFAFNTFMETKPGNLWCTARIKVQDLIIGELCSADLVDKSDNVIGTLTTRIVCRDPPPEMGILEVHSRKILDIPPLKNLKTIHDFFPALRAYISDQVYDAGRRLLKAVWFTLIHNLFDVSEASGDLTETVLTISANNLPQSQDNAIDDLLAQMAWLSELVTEKILGIPWDSAALQDIPSFLDHFGACIVRCIALIYSWADSYPASNYSDYERFATLPLEGTKQFRETAQQVIDEQELLVRLRYSMHLALSREETSKPADDRKPPYYGTDLPDLPENIHHLIAMLHVCSVNEMMHSVSNGPFVSMFECLLGPLGERAYSVMEKDYEECRKHSTPNQRDILRRLMTHLAQRTGRLPQSLVLRGVKVGSEPLARGAYGQVYRGELTIPRPDYEDPKVVAVAVKVLNPPANIEKALQIQKRLYLEVLSCRKLSHPNIVHIYGVHPTASHIGIVSTFHQRGDVRRYLKSDEMQCRQKNGPTYWLYNKWIKDIAAGMVYLHTEGLAHGDLRAANILITTEDCATIADFGLTVYVHGHSRNYHSYRSGNARWQAPEILRPPEGGSERPTCPGDVYSFSHVCIEIYTGEDPYSDIPHDIGLARLIDILSSGTRRPQRPEGMSSYLYNRLRKCWAQDPSERPPALVIEEEMSRLSNRSGVVDPED